MNISITGKINPDLDAVACAIAYEYYFKQQGVSNKIAVFQGMPHSEAVFVCDQLGILIKQWSGEIYEQTVFVDFAEMLGSPDFVGSGDNVIEMIDHRGFADYKSCPYAKYQIEWVGAATTLIAEKFEYNHISISPEIASLLYCGTISNTVNFKANVSTYRDERSAKWLISQGADVSLGVKMFEYKTQYIRDNLQDSLLNDSKIIKLLNGKTVGIMQIEILNGDFMYILSDFPTKLDTDYNIILVQDLSLEKTRIMFDGLMRDTMLQNSLGFFGGMVDSVWWEMPKIYLRKEIIPMIKAIYDN